MNKKLPKVFVLDGSVAVTGAFISARDMARALSEIADVELILSDTASIPSIELTEFAAVHYIPIRPLRRRLTDAAFYLPRLVQATWHLRQLTACEPSAIILVNDFYLTQGLLLRLLRHHGPIITWVRISPGAFGRMGQVWLAIAARLSNKIVAVSQYIQDLLPDSIKSDLLYDPISAEYLSTPSPRDSHSRNFIFLGNYIDGKGQDVAITAFARLLTDVPQARLHFHGGDMGLSRNRAYRRGLEVQAASLGISHAVTFGEFAYDTRSVLAGAFASLNLSRSESFSRTVLEASAYGLPVIATRSGGPVEIIADGDTGLMIPIDDVNACLKAMQALCSDPDLATRMGKAGRARVMQKFSPETFRRCLSELIFEDK